MDKNKTNELNNFIKTWTTHGDEVADKDTYWNTLLRILGVPQAQIDDNSYIKYEKKINWRESKFHGAIDAYIPKTRVLIEQKSNGVDLAKPEIRPNGGDKTPITPLQQAKRYDDFLPQSEKAKFFVLSNFAEIWIYDRRTNLDAKPIKLKLSDLRKQLHVLDFMVKNDTKNLPLKKEEEVSVAAGELVSKMYNELLNIFKQYKDIDPKEVQRSINALCVRLVFCLYAEDAGLFSTKEEFYNYLEPIAPNRMGIALKKLFEVLDMDNDARLKKDPFFKTDNPQLAEFPYVNGGLFSDQSIVVPPFTAELKDILLNKASRGFDWSNISPTIFGAVFESTLNPETRRQGGMHYTSVENIHKVIDPLFLDNLKAELNKIEDTYVQPKTLAKHAKEFQEKIASLTFLDPACGSGNFLTETYLSLRKLENEAIRLETRGESLLETGGTADKYIHVSIQHFFGIEINDFAVSVAKTALWIAEDQMMKETQNLIYGADWDFLPLKTYTHIHEGNALRMDWNKVLPNYSCDYIIGNPPFVGAQRVDNEQKADRTLILGKLKNYGMLDYVACWYKKATDYMSNGSYIKAAFVSTSSIAQGTQVPILWEPLFKRGVHINFAYRNFVWQNDAQHKAEVVCVIIGFSKVKVNSSKYLFDEQGKRHNVKEISPYLIEAKPIFVETHNHPLCNVPRIMCGVKFLDDNNYILTRTEKDNLVAKEPLANKYIRPYYMSRDFLNRKPRYCLWLCDANPSDLKKMPLVMERVKKVRDFRYNKDSTDAQNYKDKPLRPVRFRYFSNKHTSEALAIPRVAKGRLYLPIDLISPQAICGDKLFLTEIHTLYMFGILVSKIHTFWLKTICNRRGTAYTYSNTIVYNNFPWPDPTTQQRAKIEKTAQGILDARAKYPNSSLADLYDSLTMPTDLLKAHQANDRAVMQAYDMKPTMSESEIVAQLFHMYEKLVERQK